MSGWPQRDAERQEDEAMSDDVTISAKELAELKAKAARYEHMRYHLLVIDLNGGEPKMADFERFDRATDKQIKECAK